MAIGYSPKIVTEGLALYYDVDNVKSYRGEPTTNLATDTPSQSGWQGTYSVVDSSTKTFLITTQQDTASIGSAWRTFYWSVSSYIGSYITISADVEFVSETNCTFRDITIGQGNTGQYPTHIAGSDALDKVVNSNKPVDKTRMTWSGVINATGLVGFTYWISNVTVNGANSVLKISNVQIEAKPHATSFVNGTRSATQGLLDLTGTSTIDIAGTSFNASSEIFFDGTDDWILLTRRQYAVAEAWTAELIVNPSDAADTSWNGIFGGDLNVGGYWMFHGGGNLTYYEGYWNATAKIAYTGLILGNHFPASTNKHLTITYDGAGRYNIYINGAQAGGFDWTHTGTYSLDLRYVGGPAARYGTVQVPLMKMYDGTLTPTQISSNFNAIRSRFNI